MFIGAGWPREFPRARRLRAIGATASVLWLATLTAFVIAVTLGADGQVLACLGGLACVLFATGLVVHQVASKREWRELADRTARDDLRAARSRR